VQICRVRSLVALTYAHKSMLGTEWWMGGALDGLSTASLKHGGKVHQSLPEWSAANLRLPHTPKFGEVVGETRGSVARRPNKQVVRPHKSIPWLVSAVSA